MRFLKSKIILKNYTETTVDAPAHHADVFKAIIISEGDLFFAAAGKPIHNDHCFRFFVYDKKRRKEQVIHNLIWEKYREYRNSMRNLQ